MKAILLLSGDLSSTTLFYYLQSKGIKVYPAIFKYDARHFKEMKMARKTARILKTKPRTSCVDCACYPFSIADSEGFCSLLSAPANIESEASKQGPFRDVVFLTMACNYADQIGAEKVFYVGNGSEFILAFNAMISKINPNISVETPFFQYSKSGIVKLGLELKVPYQNTWDCYTNNERPCLVCDGCKERAKAFTENKAKDSLLTDDEWANQLRIL